MFSNLLVPIDLDHGQASVRAMLEACRIARNDGATVSVLNVYDAIDGDGQLSRTERQQDLFNFATECAAGMDVAARVVPGSSVTGAILDSIAEHGHDLVVMASHNPVMTDYLIGSTASHVALHAPCSVLVVR